MFFDSWLQGHGDVIFIRVICDLIQYIYALHVVFLSLNLNGTGAGPQEGNQAHPASGQSSDPRPQAVGVFRPSEGWGIAPHISLLGDNRRADINISLAGG